MSHTKPNDSLWRKAQLVYSLSLTNANLDSFESITRTLQSNDDQLLDIKMPNVMSKDLASRILGRDWSFGYNCYEVGHTWTPSCTDAALEVSYSAAIKVVPLYAALYGFSQVAVQQKYDLPATWETFKSVMRSSFFIFFHAYNGSVMGCALRRGFGRFYYRVLVCAPALISSYISLIIEKPARRQALAFYLLNLASEIVYRMAVTKGYFTPITHGETLLFAASLAAWYHFIKVHGFGHDPVSAAVKVLIGRTEAKSRSVSSAKDVASEKNEEHLVRMQRYRKQMQDQRETLTALQQAQQQCTYYAQLHRHACCPHEEPSCAMYVLQPLPSRFALGYVIQSLLKLTSKPFELIANPGATLRDVFVSRASLRHGLFIASLVAVGRATSCALRHYSNSNEPAWHGTVSGFMAGLSMLWAPRSSLSMYIMWKAVEQYHLQAAKAGTVKYFDFTIMTIYSCSAATILYTFALEPQLMRPSYMKFLDRLSDHRLHQLNRMVLDVFGTGSSVGYEDFFPDLHPKYMSNQFKELVFNWMIQPYE